MTWSSGSRRSRRSRTLREPGAGLDAVDRHDRDHGRPRWDHEPGRHPDGDGGRIDVDRSGSGESIGGQGAFRAVYARPEPTATARLPNLSSQVSWASGTPSVATISNTTAGTGLDAVDRHDQDHGLPRWHHEPGRHPDGDGGRVDVDRGGAGESIGGQGAFRAVYGDRDLHATARLPTSALR